MTSTACPRGERGMTMIELLVCVALALIVALGVYDIMDWSKRSYTASTDGANARSAGRATLDLMASDIRAAGYNPIADDYAGVPRGDADEIQIVADRDGDGAVGVAGEADENVTWLFRASGSAYEVVRGIDYNGDGLFTGLGESMEVTASDVVPVDLDGDGVDDPFFAYGPAEPATTRVSRVLISFGVRNLHADANTHEKGVTSLSTEVRVPNRIR